MDTSKAPMPSPQPKSELSGAAPMNPDQTMRAAEILLGCYPQRPAHDPKTYLAALAAVLCEYPAWCVQRVADPRTGIARRVKYPPTVAELIADCEEIMRPVRAEQHRVAQAAAQEADRLALEAARALRPSMAELKARFGPNWGLRTMGYPRQADPGDVHGEQ